VPVIRPTVTETTALGAAYLAGLGTGYWGSVEELQQHWAIDKRFEPDMDDNRARDLLKGWQRAVKAAIAWTQD
jgi:glycerol kinase